MVPCMDSKIEPKLAPPGAGLPAAEHLIARVLFGLRRMTGSREAFSAKFQQERSAIRALVDSCEEARRGERVLIKRVRGLEDSSRNWSVWMTLDHLRITNAAFSRIITDLTQGRIPAGRASTADVKPSPTVNAGVDAAYEQSCDAVRAVLTGPGNLKTALRFSHPWFGLMDAFGWAALAGGHMGIHCGQIERIIAGVTR